MTAEEIFFEEGEKVSGENNTFEDFKKEFLDDPQMSFIFSAMKRYARLQIYKDRERVKAKLNADWVMIKQLNETPIQLD